VIDILVGGDCVNKKCNKTAKQPAKLLVVRLLARPNEPKPRARVRVFREPRTNDTVREVRTSPYLYVLDYISHINAKWHM
jgi:tRNA A37 threonylcarbamoyladenosine dehydratase